MQEAINLELSDVIREPLTSRPDFGNGGRATDEYKLAFWNKNSFDVKNVLQAGTDSG